MALYKVLDPEEKIECPYDRTHMIARKRMQYHIMDCRKNFPNLEMSQCPFNATHMVKAPELRYHIANCRDKALIEQDIKYEQRKDSGTHYFHGDCSVPNTYHSSWSGPDESEDWDAEATNSTTFMWSGHRDHDPLEAMSATPGLPEPRTTPMVLQPHRVVSGKDMPNPRKPRAANAAANSVFSLSFNKCAKTTSGTGNQSVPATQYMTSIARGRGVGRGTAFNSASSEKVSVGVAASSPPPPPPKETGQFSDASASGPVPNSRMAANLWSKVPPGRGRPVSVNTQFFAGGVGRGRGVVRGQGQVGGSSDGDEFVTSMSELSCSSDDLTPSSASSSAQDDPKKSIRKLQKKLREIESIESKQLAGQVLNHEQEVKLLQKSLILEQIAGQK